MSAISSVGSDLQALLVHLQKVRVGQGAVDQAAQRKAALEAALQAAGADSSKLSDLEQQIQDAIQSARQNAGSSTDPHTAVRDAINNVLKQNGIDPATLEVQMKALRGNGHGHHREHRAGQPGAANAVPPEQQPPNAQRAPIPPASVPTDGTQPANGPSDTAQPASVVSDPTQSPNVVTDATQLDVVG